MHAMNNGSKGDMFQEEEKKHQLTFWMFRRLCFPLPPLWFCLLSGVSCCWSLRRLLFRIVCFCVTQLCHAWIWNAALSNSFSFFVRACRTFHLLVLRPAPSRAYFTRLSASSIITTHNPNHEIGMRVEDAYRRFVLQSPPSFFSFSSFVWRGRFQTPGGPGFLMSSPPSLAGSLRFLLCLS